MPQRIPWKRILAISFLLLLLAARLSLVGIIRADPERSLWPDSSSYLFLTERLLNGEGLHGDGSSFIDLTRTPGYPLFLWVVFSIAGGHDFALVVFLQLLMGGLIALALYWIGDRFFNRAIGFTAAVIYLLTPNAALWAMALLTDVPFTFLLTLSLVPAGLYIARSQVWPLVVAGMLLGCAALVRPITTLIVAVWTVLIVLDGFIKRQPWKRTVLHAGIFLLSAGLFIGAWILRNVLVWDRAMLSSISTWNLGHYMAPAALARAEGISIEAARELIPTTRIPQPGERERYIAILLEHPWDFIVTHFQGVRIIFTEAGRPNFAHLLGVSSIGSGVVAAIKALDFRGAIRLFFEAFQDPALRIVYPALAFSLAIQGLSYVLSVVGVVRSVWKPDRRTMGLIIVLLFTAVLLLFSPGVVGNSRFRVPAEPILALLTAVGLWGGPSKNQDEETGGMIGS